MPPTSPASASHPPVLRRGLVVLALRMQHPYPMTEVSLLHQVGVLYNTKDGARERASDFAYLEEAGYIERKEDTVLGTEVATLRLTKAGVDIADRAQVDPGVQIGAS